MPTIVEERDPITHPLDQLRGLIRRYVLIDGLLTASLFAILWYWIGLALDYGLFKATHFDWVLDAPKFLRVAAFAALALILLGILVTRLYLRLHRELSYPSLALVLEKRFPQILGDKLITAVELADIPKAKAMGYSEGMLRATIEDARQKVSEVDVKSVFDWRRLRMKGLLLALFALGILLVAFAGYSGLKGEVSPGKFRHSFGDVSLIWAERNLLLRNTPWPRQAHLELIDFPGGELRVGKDTSAPKVTVRAFKWVVADRGAVHGWRPMLLGDVWSIIGLAAPPTVSVEDGDTEAFQTVQSWDVDRIEAALGSRPGMMKLLARLEEQAAKPENSRTFRKLAIPEEVTLTYDGFKTSGKVSLTRETNNVFTGEVAGLKESVRFTVKGADFSTTPRSITLVPPPMFTRLTRTEYQPAYLYYPPPVTGPVSDFTMLKGLRQSVATKDLSLTGDKSVFTIVQGTEFEIAGTTDKKLKQVLLQPKFGPLPGQKKPTEIIEIEPAGDRESFSIAFRGPSRPSSNLEFEIVLVDDDNVRSIRTVLVQVVEDQAPSVELAVDILRKQGNFYLVTPIALVPFVTESKVRDDLALSKVEFTFTVSQVESGIVLGVQAQTLAGVFASVPLFPSVADAYMPATSAVFTQSMTKASAVERGSMMVSRFQEQFLALSRETPENLKNKLSQPADSESAQVIREVKFQNQLENAFDLRAALPSLAAEGDYDKRHRIELALVATDANVETGPKQGQSLEPIRLLVISQEDLLGEFSRDEESQAAKLDEVLRKLREAQSKLGQMADRLASLSVPPDVITSAAVRAQDIAQDIAKSREVTTGVLAEYNRLYREAQFNRIRVEILNRYASEIIAPLSSILEKSFLESEQAHQQLQGALAENRRPDDPLLANDRFLLSKLIADLESLRQKLGEAVTLNKLRNELVQMLDRQKAIGRLLKMLKQELVLKLYLPELATLPVIELGKGETKSVRHPLNWKAYTGGSLTVTIAGPGDDKLKVPASVKVADDRDDFDWTVTAGQTPGEYKLTLSPSAGSSITVLVRVK